MNQEHRGHAENLVRAALQKPPEARGAFLDSACGADSRLRRQVEQLLANAPSPGSDTAAETVTASILGRQIGPYRLVAPLGAGGMGEVYRAQDSKLGREVALKTLPSEFARDPERLGRFRREARALASLNHPNIAAIYGLEESGDVECLVLELVEGETLRGPLPIPVALDRARQVADALEAAHSRGIIHRDLKPSNVKVTPQGRVKVLDFGLAKAIAASERNEDGNPAATVTEGRTQVGRVLGTPGYMSPEQARGLEVDERADIWAFGCLFYELLTGKRVFRGDTNQDTLAAVLEREPDWQALPAKTPAAVRDLLRDCLQKEVARRPRRIADIRKKLEREQGGRNRWRGAAIAATALAIVAVGVTWWLRGPGRPPDRSQWVQLTKFADSVGQPALSPDGKMVAFIRGSQTFVTDGEIYVKILPDGDAQQLTHDGTVKMSPVFTPDGSRIAYTVENPNTFEWDTWTVPVLGGTPQLMLKNASGLVWTGPHQVMFSEIKMGVHMALETSADNRVGERDVYVPAGEPDMAHRSYLSPNGKWVLLVEMVNDHRWKQCRLVPADGSSPGHNIGPPGGGCTFAAWTPDGKWMYFNSNAVEGIHIWRQRFPDGAPEQVTSGPTEEEGIAMAPDGKSIVTAVALQNTALWVHDSRGERQVSLEGNAAQPFFTPDGKKILYRIVREAPGDSGWYRDAGEVRIADLESGRSEPVVRGLAAFNYDLSPDGREIAMETADAQGKPRIWLASLDHSAPPRLLSNAEGGYPQYGPDREILFFHVDTGGGTIAGTVAGYVYRVQRDGTGLKRALEAPVLQMGEVWQQGRRLIAWAPLPKTSVPAWQALSLDGGPPLLVPGPLYFGSAQGGRLMSIGFTPTRTYVIPGDALTRLPAGRAATEQEVARLAGVRRIDATAAISGPTPDLYAFYKGAVQRNLYRIPLP